MYLSKYAGMSVGIFERRHEIGGGLATEEIAAPGFRGNTHANMAVHTHWLPIYRDFPEFWEYGGRVDQYRVSNAASFLNNGTCITIYSEKVDPTQEKTAAQIARFSEKDADKWLKIWEVLNSDIYQRMNMDIWYSPAEDLRSPKVMERQMALMPLFEKAGIHLDSLIMTATPSRSMRELFESPELQYCSLRVIVSGGMDICDAGNGAISPQIMLAMPTCGYVRGGTHMIAHAAHQILLQNGVKIFTHCEADKVLIENGRATGIRLSDGTEIKARKIVVSAGLNPRQLVELIGRDIVGERIAKRVDLLSTRNIGCLMWYSFALHEAPIYKSEAFNPDVHETFWHALATSPNPDHIETECKYAKLGQFPPLEDFSPTVWCHSLVDPSYAPAGKHVAQNEMQGPPLRAHTEREWLEIKKRYAEDLITFWSKHAPNMTWDNIIGVDTNSPYDCVRLKNIYPDGNFAQIDLSLCQRMENRPIPELANHRTPVQNLYCTGGSWKWGGNMGADAGYNCYKIIAKDLPGLGKPWEEPGKEEPDSLVQESRRLVERIQNEFKRP
jgi:phytoene dehydrogenase-like protein